MGMTIKELADSLGVSKTAVRKRFTEEFSVHINRQSDGSIIIDDEGCKLIAESLRITANYGCCKTANKAETVAETSDNTANILLQTTIEALKQQNAILTEQLKVKDNQITEQMEQIKRLTESLRDSTTALSAAQALHAGTIQQQLNSDTTKEKDVNVKTERSIWRRLFRKD